MYVVILQVSHDQDDNYTMPGITDRVKAESAGRKEQIRTLINQGVSLFLFLWRLNQELPVLGHSPWGAAEQVCEAWSKVRALSGKECFFTFHKLKTQLDLEVGR